MSLTGKRVVVTRPRAQAADLCQRLAALGAEPIGFPTVEIAPMPDYAALDRAIAQLSGYAWLIFTSANGVRFFWQRLEVCGATSAALNGIRVAAIGPATARALESRGIAVQFIPEEYVAERILDGMGEVSGKWILLPRADIAREALAVELCQRGAIVHEVPAYRNLPAAPDPAGLAALRRGVDVITFTSSSTVRNFLTLAGEDLRAYGAPLIACIGPITAQTARECRLPVGLVADEYTLDGLVAALERRFAMEPSGA